MYIQDQKTQKVRKHCLRIDSKGGQMDLPVIQRRKVPLRWQKISPYGNLNKLASWEV